VSRSNESGDLTEHRTTSDRLWYTGTHGKGGLGTILYEESLKDRSLRRDIAQPKCNNGMRDRGLKQQLPLRSKGNINETLKQAIVLRSSGWQPGLPSGFQKWVPRHWGAVTVRIVRLDAAGTGKSADASKTLNCHPPGRIHMSQTRPLGKDGYRLLGTSSIKEGLM
jgi:hypothetical protein